MLKSTLKSRAGSVPATLAASSATILAALTVLIDSRWRFVTLGGAFVLLILAGAYLSVALKAAPRSK